MLTGVHYWDCKAFIQPHDEPPSCRVTAKFPESSTCYPGCQDTYLQIMTVSPFWSHILAHPRGRLSVGATFCSLLAQELATGGIETGFVLLVTSGMSLSKSLHAHVVFPSPNSHQIFNSDSWCRLEVWRGLVRSQGFNAESF